MAVTIPQISPNKKAALVAQLNSVRYCQPDEAINRLISILEVLIDAIPESES